MKTYLLLACGLLLTAPAALAQTKPATAAAASTAAPVTAAQRQAAEALLTTMQVDKTIATAVDQMMTLQMQQNPQLQTVEPEMRAFMNKYMSWAAVKDDMIQLYAREFTTAELNNMKQFFQSPTGQKFIGKQSSMMQESMLIGQRRVQEHLPELEQAISGKLKEAQPTKE